MEVTAPPTSLRIREQQGILHTVTRPSGPLLVSTSEAAFLALLEAYQWPVSEALHVVMCESSGDPSAYYAGNYGLFQINEVHGKKVSGNLDTLFDPEVNVRVAHDIWRDQGWAPWACRP